MTKISKILTAASVLGVMSLAVLPAAGYALDPDTGVATLKVVIGESCLIGDQDINSAFPSEFLVNLSTSDLTGEDASEADAGMGIACTEGWDLTEQAVVAAGDTGDDDPTNLDPHTSPDPASYANSFGPSASTGDQAVASLGNNQYGVYYVSSGAGATLTPAAGFYHGLTASPVSLLTAAGGTNTANFSLAFTFGAKWDGTLDAGTYETNIQWTLTPESATP